MSYQLEDYEPLPAAIRRITREEIDTALAHLTDANPNRDEVIHEARKCFKKIRAVLRLIVQPKVADELGKEIYKRENLCYRDAGRCLSDLRESAVMVETLDKVANHFAQELDAGVQPKVAEVRSALVQSHQALSQRLYDEEKVIDVVVATLHPARARLASWPIAGDDFTAIVGGLRRVYQRGRRCLAHAYANRTAEDFHEWRKQVKYLWYHLTILEPLRPEVLQRTTTKLHDLSDYLGDDHDLFALRRRLQQGAGLEAIRIPPLLVTLIECWRTEIQTAARPLGERLYAEEPDVFVKRMGHY
ncbi:MAG TPA: CHAD domain-containing protein, partial [Anaerolineae bacterium]